MIPAKSRSGIRQYLPKKPHKWGLKIWARCGISGFCYDCDVYVGKRENYNEEDENIFGRIGAVVLTVIASLERNVNHKVYMDNLFTLVKVDSP